MSVQHIVTGWDHDDLLDRILDKGIVVDSAGRVRLPAEDLANSEQQVVLRSAETPFTRTARATNQ